MKIVKQSYEIIDDLNPEDIYKKIEKIARTCYKSEKNIKEGSAEKMVKALVLHQHEAMLEHATISVKFITDRAIANEIVRHRAGCSYAQESTRYVNYKEGVEFVEPYYISDEHDEAFVNWSSSCLTAEDAYKKMIEYGCSPQEARDVLPLCAKTELVVTANLRSWRHIFDLRVLGTTGAPHPKIKALMEPLLIELGEKLPIIFGDQLEVLRNEETSSFNKA